MYISLAALELPTYLQVVVIVTTFLWVGQSGGGGRIFLPLSRPALGLTWHPVCSAPTLFPGVKAAGA